MSVPGYVPKHRTRNEIVEGVRRLRDKSRQIIIDCESWNDNVRRTDEEPIDPDPDNRLARVISACDAFLAADTGHGPLPPLNVFDGDSSLTH